MLGDMIVADATMHGYNWAESNLAVPEAAPIVEASYGLHHLLTSDPSLELTYDEFVRDWPIDQAAETLYFEGGVDLVCHHGTPIHDFFFDGHADTEKGFELKKRFPGRSLAYGAINPFVLDDAAAIRREVDRLVDAGSDGLKLYAGRYVGGKTYAQRLDDEKHAYPMIERALERGVRAIATHKAVPLGPVHYEPYGVADIPGPCAEFPEMNFEIVHAGMAFVEETAFLAASFPNCWFNLETSFAMIRPAPRRFAQLLGALLAMGAADRILYASGLSLVHPLVALRAFAEFEMPQDLVEEFGLPPLTDEVKRKILGENLLRLHGMDVEATKARVGRPQSH
jgi:uncharacterized protein